MIGFAVASLSPVEVGELLEAKPDRPPAYVEPDDRKPTQTGFQGIVFGAIVGEGNCSAEGGSIISPLARLQRRGPRQSS